MTTQPAAEQATAILLPEHLRLPDLSTVRTFTDADVNEWTRLADLAIAWGPARRNGCIRHVPVSGTWQWLDGDGELHSPDPWTPAAATATRTQWSWHGSLHGQAGRPALIDYLNCVLVWREHGRRHRPHAPAVLRAAGAHAWWWRNREASAGLARLLTDAWASGPVADEHAHGLLDRAGALDDTSTQATPTVAWVAHVLAGNPHATLTAQTRAWLALLTV